MIMMLIQLYLPSKFLNIDMVYTIIKLQCISLWLSLLIKPSEALYHDQ